MKLLNTSFKLLAAALLAASVSGSIVLDAYAKSSGNGNSGNAGGGNGNGGGNKGNGSAKNSTKNSGATQSRRSKKTSAIDVKAKTANTKTAKGASALGKLNGFMNASVVALAKASPTSAIGKVSVVYAGLLNEYLLSGGVSPTAAEVAAALNDAANKPLSPEAVAAVNARLLETNVDLQSNLGTKTVDELNQEISAALTVN